MKLAIVGSRGWVNRQAIITFVSALPKDTVIITGGARGVDQFAMEAAKIYGLKLVVYYPDYNKYGKRAPLERNLIIAADCDEMAIFWDGKSTGSRHVRTAAEKLNKPVAVFMG